MWRTASELSRNTVMRQGTHVNSRTHCAFEWPVRWVSRCASEAPLWCTKPLFGYHFALCLRIAHCALHDPLWVLMCVAYCVLCALPTHFGSGCALRIAYCALRGRLWVWMCVAYCALTIVRVARPTLGVDVRCVLRIVRCASHFGCALRADLGLHENT